MLSTMFESDCRFYRFRVSVSFSSCFSSYLNFSITVWWFSISLPPSSTSSYNCLIDDFRFLRVGLDVES